MKHYLINTGETKKEFVIHSDEDWVVSSRGTAISATLAGELPNISPATLRISSGGVALYTAISLGKLIVSSGGTASYTSAYSNQRGTYMGVLSGGTADNTSVFAYGFCSVDGIATNNLIYGTNAQMDIGSGGSASRTTVGMSGYFYVVGSADDTVVDDRGSMILSQGGLAYKTTVSSGGKVEFRDGSAGMLDIQSGGSMLINDSNGTNFLSSATVYSGGTAKVEGAVAVSKFVDYGEVYVYGGGVMSSVQNDPSNLVVMDQGTLRVLEGGTVNGFTVSSGASFTVMTGGKITGKMTIQNGAVISCVEGTIDFDLTQTSAGANAALVNNLSLLDNANMLRHPEAYTITVDGKESSGIYKVANGASDFNATVTVMNTAGTELGTITANGLDSVVYAGKQYVLNLSNSALTVVVAAAQGDDKIFTGVVSSGTKYIESGCSAVGAQVIDTGVLSVESKGSVINTTMRDGGMLVVSSGAKKVEGNTFGPGGSGVIWQDVNASNTVVDGGMLAIWNGGYAFQYTNNGQSIVSSNTIVKNDGILLIYADGHVSGAYVSDGGYVEVAKDGEFVLGKIVNGSVCVRDGGFVSRMNLERGGILNVESGGVARHINVSAGGVLTGVLREADELRFYDGTLDLNISHVSGGNEYLVDEQSFLHITPLQNYSYSCTLTIDNSQEAGTYNLIECATGFDKVITVQNLDGEELGTLTVGGDAITIGALNYTLNQAVDGSLSVSLVQGGGGQGGDGPDPLIILPDAFYTGDFNGDGSDMLAVRYDSYISIYRNGEPWGSLSLDYGWRINGIGDFNGDGFDDFLRVSDEGYVVGEMSNGDGTFSPQVLNFLNTGWDILGIGDFDSTGYDDVLIANPTAASDTVGLIGYWEGGSTWVLINGYSAEWDMIATGDFNGDGNCDMLWRNSFVGDDEQVYNAYCTWLVGLPEEFGPGGPTQDWFIVSVANPAEWNFLCAGDFDGDNTNDIAMINNEGVVGIWGVQGGTLSTWSILSAVTPEWQLAGVADFNADGTDDIAWCSSTTGQVGAWIVQDKELASWQVLANIGY